MHLADLPSESSYVVGGETAFDGSALSATTSSRDFQSEMQAQYPLMTRQMAHDSEYTEDINSKMRVPVKLTATSHSNEHFMQPQSRETINVDVMQRMEVPDRIVVSVGDSGIRYHGAMESSGSPLYGDHFLPMRSEEPVSLITPPRKLTLAERNLDALDIQNERDVEQSNDDRKVAKPSNPSSLLAKRTIPEMENDDSSVELDDISILQQQILQLRRKINAIEKLQHDRSKRDKYFYIGTIAFWLINGWFLYSARRSY